MISKEIFIQTGRMKVTNVDQAYLQPRLAKIRLDMRKTNRRNTPFRIDGSGKHIKQPTNAMSFSHFNIIYFA